MPYHNFEDAAHVAKYIADINFSITGTAPVDSSPDKVKYYCSFTKHDITFDTTYQPPSAVDGEPTAADVLSLLADDALAIIDNNYSIDDFADEYGYHFLMRVIGRHVVLGVPHAVFRRELATVDVALIWKESENLVVHYRVLGLDKLAGLLVANVT